MRRRNKIFFNNKIDMLLERIKEEKERSGVGEVGEGGEEDDDEVWGVEGGGGNEGKTKYKKEQIKKGRINIKQNKREQTKKQKSNGDFSGNAPQ